MSAARTSPYITFFAGDEQFAAEAKDVSEIFRRPRITRVPGGPPGLLGIAGLRGAAVPVVSLARLTGREERPGPEARLLLLSGEPALGLAVDRVGPMIPLPAPEGPADEKGFGRLYAVENSALRAVDLEGLLQRAFTRPVGEPRRASGPVRLVEDETELQAEVVLLAFELAGQTYALPLADVSEVLTFPQQMATIAQADDAVIGVHNLRGRLLPVASLRRLLGLADKAGPEGRVVVCRIGEALVGLAVDRLQAILRAPETAIDVAPSILNRAPGEAQVQAICRMPDGRGLVAILSAERLFRDDKVAHILADGRKESREMDESSGRVESGRYLVFRIGGDEYGLPLPAVDEVVRLPERLTKVPRSPEFVEGVLNLRGRITPVIDQRSRFESPSAPGGSRPRIVVTTVGGRQAGFIVDAVTEILDLIESQLEPAPEMTADAGRLFHRIASLDRGERLILLIDPQELLDRAERDLLAGMDVEAQAQP